MATTSTPTRPPRPVGEGEGVGVLAQRRGGVGVSEAGLGLKDLAAGDEEGGDVVTQAVERGVRYVGSVAESGKAVPEAARREVLVMTLVTPVGRRVGRR